MTACLASNQDLAGLVCPTVSIVCGGMSTYKDGTLDVQIDKNLNPLLVETICDHSRHENKDFLCMDP